MTDFNDEPTDNLWAKWYDRRRAELDKAQRDGSRDGCEPWCEGPSAHELALYGTHSCPPELTTREVDELQLQTLLEERDRARSTVLTIDDELHAVLVLVKAVVGDRCVIHGEDGVVSQGCPWCRLCELSRDAPS